MKTLDQERTGILEIGLSAATMQLFEDATADFPPAFLLGQEGNAIAWLEQRGREISSEIEPELLDALRLVPHRSSGIGAAVVRTTEISDMLPPTPEDHLSPTANRLYPPDLHRGLLLGAVGLFGYGFASQQQGSIYNNILVARSHLGLKDNSSTVHPLGMHTEDSYFCDHQGGISPDVLTLHYFRNFERVSTPLAVVDTSDLLDDLRQILSEPRFTIQTSTSHGKIGDTSEKLPILYGDETRPFVRFNEPQLLANRDRHSAAEQAAIADFLDHIASRTIEFVGSSGDILFVDNRSALHGKGRQDTQAFDGQGRWHRRVATVTDLDKLLPYFSDERVVDVSRYITHSQLTV